MAKNTRKVNLTKAQEAFCRAYALNGGNGVDAYRKAYPKTKKSKDGTVAAMASKLLSIAKITQRIAQKQSKVQEIAEKKFEVTAESLIQEMAAIAYQNADDYFEWGTEDVTRTTRDGDTYVEKRPVVRLKASVELSMIQKKAVAGVEQSFSKAGDPMVAVKLADKRAAIKDLFAMAGFAKPTEVTGANGGPIQVVMSAAEANL